MRGHRIIFMVISFVIFIVTPVFSSDIVSRTLLSMIQSFIGRRYLSREDSVKPPLSIYIDEASNIIYPGIEDLFNKSRRSRRMDTGIYSITGGYGGGNRRRARKKDTG